MKIRVLRDACCAADDQAGPLELKIELDAPASLQDLVETVLASGFLQYSSSHTSMLGFVDDAVVVRVFSLDYTNAQPHYLVDPATPIGTAVSSGLLDFRF
ncbi:hypothetical protein [Pseudoduganella violaceinigra]|uniref:hypothetical protein n=1 Tax=Pseudoduganella violaceinigra TaxID=246602 RepID=UPI000685D853|nr:hypothetical protein [Pseudoduganella violaceinigra]